MMAARILTQQRLHELLRYDLETGVFTYACARPKVRVGAVAGHTHAGHGYRQIKLDGRLYLAHRLAWLYVHGRWPSDMLDHIDRDRTNNRLSNLRESDRFLNRQNALVPRNSTSGIKGVTWNSTLGKWHARIGFGNKRHHVGWFHSAEDAALARAAAEKQMHMHRPI
jgi:hypothetical protein